MLKHRFALWALGLALPQVSVLKPMVHRGLRSIALIVFAGIMLAVIVTGGLAMLFIYLTESGLTQSVAAWVVLGIAALLALIAWMLAMRQMRSVAEVPQQLRLFDHPVGDMLGDAASLLAAGFLEGLLKPEEPRHRCHDRETDKL